ncbi:MAG: DUF4340 domain-containing protein [Verrucomicrobiaceae bacterium]|nr:DUF4340 domain-containing protein [Verrucomicrobiaceae bacterium]
MKKSLLLLVILAGILGVAFYKKNERNSRLNTSANVVKTRELLFPDFDINGIKKLRIKEDKQETTIEVKGDQWVVTERGGYPANKEKLQEVLMGLKYEPIKAGRRIGKDSWGKIGVNSPGDATAFGVGTLVELFDEAGTVKHSFVLGGSVTSSGGGNENPMSMFGGGGQGNRFIRIKDQDTIWEVANKFEGLVNKPAEWVLKDFIAIAKIKDITVTAPKAEDSWKASRKAEADTDFTLEGAKPGESIDSTKADVASLLSSPQFTDVLAKDKAAETFKDAVKAVINTFDGFTYNLQAVKKSVDGGDKWFMTVTTTAKIADKRDTSKDAKDEKPEDKKKKDDEFAAEKKTLEEKLAKEKAADGWVYEVTEYTINTLLKKRSEIVKVEEKKEEKPAVPGITPNTPIPGIPSAPPAAPGAATPPPAATPITVTTPPIAVPPAPEMPKTTNPTAEALKDKPATPPAAPKVELKPAPEAPKAEAPKAAEPKK